MKELTEQRARTQVPFPEFFVSLPVVVLLTVGLGDVARGLPDAGRWACLYAGPAASGALAFFVSKVASPGLVRGCALGMSLVLLIVPTFLAEPMVGLVAGSVIALASFAFVIVTLSRAFELGKGKQEPSRHGR